MDFKVYYKSRVTGEVEVRWAVRVDDSAIEGVVWLKNGGWIRINEVFLTWGRADRHKYKDPPGTLLMPPDNER